MSVSQVSVGSFVRPSDTEPLAKIVYMASVYVAFTVPQRNLADLRQAMAARTATIEVIVPGASKPAAGQVTMVDHTVDATSGMVTVRATMANADNAPVAGCLVSARLTLRNEDTRRGAFGGRQCEPDRNLRFHGQGRPRADAAGQGRPHSRR